MIGEISTPPIAGTTFLIGFNTGDVILSDTSAIVPTSLFLVFTTSKATSQLNMAFMITTEKNKFKTLNASH